MAEIKRGIPFKDGNPGGPGRPTMSTEEKQLSKLTRTKFNNIVRQYLDMDKAELKVIEEDVTTKTLDRMVIAVMLKAIDEGDQKRINWFLEQLFGKLAENVNMTTNVVTHASIMQRIKDRKNGVIRQEGEGVDKND